MRKMAVGFLSTAVLAGLTVGLPTGPASAAEPSPTKNGECYNLSSKQLDSGSLPTGAKPVACTEPHTLEVVGIPTVPSRISRYGYGSMAVNAWTMARCDRFFAGSDGAQGSNLNWTSAWFYPTASQWKTGSRWVVCGGTQVKWSNGDYRPYAIAEAYTAKRPKTRIYYTFKKGSWRPVKPGTSGSRPLLAYRPLGWKNMETMAYPGAKAIEKRARFVLKRDYRNWRKMDVAVTDSKSAWKQGDGRFFAVLGARRG